MAMTQSSLSTRIKTELEAVFGGAQDSVEFKKYTDAIAKAIIDEIQANATLSLLAGDIPVNPGTFTNGGGPVTGVGQSQAVTLNGKIT